MTSTEGKTECREWHTDGWSSYERVLPSQVEHYVSKALTQRVERTNGTLRQQTGRWHRRQNKFSKLWQQTELTVRLVVTYFNWIWRHSCLGTVAALACRVNWSCLDLEWYCCLSHASIGHDPRMQGGCIPSSARAYTNAPLTRCHFSKRWAASTMKNFLRLKICLSIEFAATLPLVTPLRLFAPIRNKSRRSTNNLCYARGTNAIAAGFQQIANW